MNLGILWDLLVTYGYQIRSSNQKGLDSWNAIKSLIPDMSVAWSESSKTIYDKLAKLGVNTNESSADAKMEHKEWERHHYLLQHGRIVRMNPEGSLMRLLQIAYNVGQFKCELERQVYPVEQLRFYILNDLNKLEAYTVTGLDRVDVNPLVKRLLAGSEMKGGSIDKNMIGSSHPDYMIDLSKLPENYVICEPYGMPADISRNICNPLTGRWLHLNSDMFNKLLKDGVFVNRYSKST